MSDSFDGTEIPDATISSAADKNVTDHANAPGDSADFTITESGRIAPDGDAGMSASDMVANAVDGSGDEELMKEGVNADDLYPRWQDDNGMPDSVDRIKEAVETQTDGRLHR